MPLRSLLLVLCALIAGQCAAQSPAAVPQVGVAAHLGGLSEKDVDAQIAAAQAAHLKVVRWDTPWRIVEKDKGQYEIPARWDYIVDHLRAKGMESLLVLDYGNKLYDNGDKPTSMEARQAYADYAAALAKHFAGRVPYYEIWNEWNSRIGKTSRGRSEDYAALAKKSYAAIKAADPAAKVVLGGFSSSSNDSIVGYGNREATFESLLSQDIASYCDAVSIHPYVVYRDGPTRSRDGFHDLMRKVVARIRKTPGMASKPIYITEIGWSTANGSGRGVSEDEQAQYINDAIDLSGQLGISLVVLYELIDGNNDSSDTEGAFGLLHFNKSPKAAYSQLQARH
jgi:hypothetical protein